MGYGRRNRHEETSHKADTAFVSGETEAVLQVKWYLVKWGLCGAPATCWQTGFPVIQTEGWGTQMHETLQYEPYTGTLSAGIWFQLMTALLLY